MKAAEDCRPMGTRPEKLPAPRRHKATDEGALLRVDWVDELFTVIDTRRR
jgi:hypothetical protein